MAAPNQPGFFKRIFASMGQRATIPDDKPQPGRASQKEGFPPETQLPMNQGGVAPNRMDFNGMFGMLSAFSCYAQSGGVFAWSEELGYKPPAFIYHGGKLWWCVAENGPGSAKGVKIPGTDETAWRDFLLAMAGNAGGGGSGPGDLVSIFGGNPVGTIIHYYGTTAPYGYLALDGSLFDVVANPQLYSIVGSNRLPDARGCFLRMYKQGTTSPMGTKQEDAGRNVIGEFNADNAMRGLLDGIDWPLTGCFTLGDDNNWDATSGHTAPQGGGYIKLDASRNWGLDHTANEFRPVNYAVLFCIKHD